LLAAAALSSFHVKATLALLLSLQCAVTLFVYSVGDKPLIIRKIDNYYALVGDSYIYGLMDGEALLEAANRNLSFQELALI
jgi:hypothetical protein